MKTVIEAYHVKHGVYPEAILADKAYRNRENLKFCKERNIRLSGPKLGRPSKIDSKQQKEQEAKDAAERNPVEGKFGETKTKYGLARVMAKLKNASETIIELAFFCANVNRRLRFLLYFFSFFPEGRFRKSHLWINLDISGVLITGFLRKP